MNPVVKTIYCLMIPNRPHYPDVVMGVLHTVPKINGTPGYLVSEKVTSEWLIERLETWMHK